MKKRKKVPGPRHRPGPYHSKMKPFADQIREWRRDGDTWAQVVAKLKEKGVETDAGSACRFIKRIETKPYGIGQRPNIEPRAAIQPLPNHSAPQPEPRSTQSTKAILDGIKERSKAQREAQQEAKKKDDNDKWPDLDPRTLSL